MLQRLIGVSLGGLVTFLILQFVTAFGSDPASKYAIAVIIGAIVSFLWPWLIGIILVRRAKQRRANQVSDEVARQMAGK